MVNHEGTVTCDNCGRKLATVSPDPKLVVVGFSAADVTDAVKAAGGTQVEYDNKVLEFGPECVR